MNRKRKKKRKKKEREREREMEGKRWENIILHKNKNK